MSIRFYRRLRIFPGLRLNLSKSGISTSVGGRGAWLTFRPGHKARSTIGLPGSGLRFTTGGERVPATTPRGTADRAPDTAGAQRQEPLPPHQAPMFYAIGLLMGFGIMLAIAGGIVWLAVHFVRYLGATP